MVVAAVILLIAAGAYVTYLWTQPEGSPSGSPEVRVARDEIVTVPDVVGMAEDAARAELESLELQVSTIDVFDTAETQTVGSVVAQMPEAGTEWIQGQPVAFAVAAGPDDGTGTAVPNVVDSSFDQAIKELAAAGLLAVGITEDPAQVDSSQVEVVAQLPAEGIKVPQGSTVLVRLGQ